MESIGVVLISEERQRQITTEGWTPEHDDTHQDGELARAAGCYAKMADLLEMGYGFSSASEKAVVRWPWDASWWKPAKDPVRNLAKAGALIAAEIDRIQRSRSKIQK